MSTGFDFFSTGGCLLCDEMENNSPLSVRLGFCDHPRKNILLESDNFVFIPDISPIIPGHCLIVPRVHFPSFAKIPEGCIEELRDFKKECGLRISREHQRPILFEHGSGPLAPRSGACVHHAHIHLLPIRAPVARWMSEFGPIRRLGRLAQYELPGRFALADYLAFQDQDERSFLVADIETRPPCQFIRRRVAEYLRLADWHWESAFSRVHPPTGVHSAGSFTACPATAGAR